MATEINLYIPTGVKATNELFNGFGKRELLQSVIGSLFGGAVAALLWLIAGNVALTVVAVLSGIFGSVMQSKQMYGKAWLSINFPLMLNQQNMNLQNGQNCYILSVYLLK